MGWKYVSGEGLWQNYKNEETGEETVKTHTPKVVWKSCKPESHIFEITGNRELQCKKCGVIAQFVPGRDNKFLKSQNIT